MSEISAAQLPIETVFNFAPYGYALPERLRTGMQAMQKHTYVYIYIYIYTNTTFVRR